MRPLNYSCLPERGHGQSEESRNMYFVHITNGSDPRPKASNSRRRVAFFARATRSAARCYKRYVHCYLPTYPGVPQAVDMTLPLPSILESPKSLIMIFEPSWGLKYSRFSGYRGEKKKFLKGNLKGIRDTSVQLELRVWHLVRQHATTLTPQRTAKSVIAALNLSLSSES